MGLEGAYFNIIKAIYNKPTTSIILNGQNLNAFSLRSGMSKGCPLSPRVSDIVLEVLVTAIRQQKEIKDFQIKRKDVKLSLFADDIIVYVENPINTTKRLLNLISEFGKTAGYKINIQKLKAFLYTNNKTSETEIRGKIPFAITKEKIKYLGINLTKKVNENYRTLRKKLRKT